MKVQIELKGFTPLLDVLVKDFGIVTASVYGIVWRYAQMEDKVCRASLEKIADRVNVSSKTAERHIKKLCTSGYLEDLTPGVKNKPHIYIVTGKAELAGVVSPEIRSDRESDLDQLGQTESPTRSDRESYQGQTESPLKIHSKKDNKDINGSAKNSQNQNGEDGFDRADQTERDNLNFIANQLARVTKIRVATTDEPTIERLKKAALLGYQLAEYCQISLSKLKPREINGHFRYSKALENFLGDIITLAADGVTPADLKANKDWWYNKYWLGRDKNQPPTSAQVCAMWGQFEAAQSALASATAGPQLSDVAKANYARLLAEQAK
jgi:Mn-dependent DtxR family transcriptional regulator